MCGRYTMYKDPDELDKEFDCRPTIQQALGDALKPRFNIAPTQEVLTVGLNGERVPRMMRWGLIPFWAKDHKIGSRSINARGETVATNRVFRNAFKQRRCLVIADGFYEWKRRGKTDRTPYRIGLKSWSAFAFAGMWERWKSPEGEEVLSCTVVTTLANEFMGPIHDRMPVILPKDAEGIWLDPSSDPGDLRELLVPHDSSEMAAYEVSPLVNSWKNESPECVEPAS